MATKPLYGRSDLSMTWGGGSPTVSFANTHPIKCTSKVEIHKGGTRGVS